MLNPELANLLPGLWFLGLAAALAAVLHRIFDPLPRPALAAFAVVLALAFGPVLFMGRSFLPLDSLRGHAPFLTLEPATPPANPLQGDLLLLIAPAGAEVRRALAHGEPPFWAAELGAGMPLLADPQAQVLQPLVVAALPFPITQAVGITAALQVFVALVFALLLFERLGLRSPAALFGAFAWGLGSFLAVWLGWPIANTAAWLPACLYATMRVVGCGGRRDLALLAATTFSLLVGGHPETIVYALVLIAGWGLEALGRQGWPRRRSRRLAAGLGLGFALAAPALLPAGLYLPQTLRASRLAEVRPEPVAAGALARAELRLLPIVAPQVFGNDRYYAYWGPESFNEDAAGFMGTASLLLAGLALLPGRRRRPGERLSLGFGLAGLLVVAQVPGVLDLLGGLPGGGASGGQHRLLLLIAWALVMAATAELDRRLTGEGRAWPVVAVGLLLASVIAWATLGHAPPGGEGLAILRLGWLRWQLRFLAGASAVLLLAWQQGRWRGERWRPLCGWALAVAVAAELLLLHRPLHPPAPERLAFPRTPPLAALAAASSQAGAAGYRLSGLDLALPPNLAAVYGWSDARLYNPLAPATYVAALAPLIEGWSGEAPHLGQPEHPLYDLLGVRWLLVPPGTPRPDAFRVLADGPDGALWERPSALPRLFLPASALPQPAAWPAALAAITDFRAGALIEGLRTPWQAREVEAGRLEIGELASHRLRARFASPEPRWLASSLYQDGGWTLRVDGHPVPTTRSNGPFLAALLPAGEHRLELCYRPPGFLAGCLLAVVGMLGAGWGWRRWTAT